MPEDDAVSQWLHDLQAGDSTAAQKLWERYFPRLVHLARNRLPSAARRVSDEEDVALSAFKSFCLGLERGRFPQLEDREDLWALLVVITARKAQAHVRHQTRQKRGGGKVLTETDLVGDDGTPIGINDVVSKEPTPEFAAQVAEECERLLDCLDDDDLRTTALLKMEGYTRDEMAEKLNRSTSSIARRLDLIRQLWTERASAGDDE